MSNICPKCGKQLSSKRNLINHLNKKKSCGASNPYKCKFCDKTYSHQTTAISHSNTCEMNPINNEDQSFALIQQEKTLEYLIKKIEDLDKKIENYGNSTNSIIFNGPTNFTNILTKTNIVNACYNEAKNFNANNFDLSISTENELRDGNSPTDWTINFFVNRMIKNVPVHERSIWCIDLSRKIFLVRIDDNWRQDTKGKIYALNTIEEMKDKLHYHIINKVNELQQKLFELDDEQDSNLFKELTKEKNFYLEFSNFLGKKYKSKNKNKAIVNAISGDNILQGLTPYIIFDKKTNKISNVENKVIEYFKNNNPTDEKLLKYLESNGKLGEYIESLPQDDKIKIENYPLQIEHSLSENDSIESLIKSI